MISKDVQQLSSTCQSKTGEIMESVLAKLHR